MKNKHTILNYFNDYLFIFNLTAIQQRDLMFNITNELNKNILAPLK